MLTSVRSGIRRNCVSETVKRSSLLMTSGSKTGKITKIDHIHVYVENIALAEEWYKDVLDFTRNESLYFWFEQGGPLVISNNDVSLSLFTRKHQFPGHTIALAIETSAFTKLISTLREKDIAFTLCDHDVSVSLYLCDLSDNSIEFTCYDYAEAKQNMQKITSSGRNSLSPEYL